MSGDYSLENQGLTKEFRGFIAGRDVSLRIRRHTIHALIGPTGAGKTTVFNLLTKFLTPSAGRLVYYGPDITVARRGAIARSGMVRSFQISPVFPHISDRAHHRAALQKLKPVAADTRVSVSVDLWRHR